MTLHVYLLTTVSHRAMCTAMPRLGAREIANVLAWAYGGLALQHLNRRI